MHKKILIIFAGSLGHYLGFSDFMERVMKGSFNIYVASHKIEDIEKLRTPYVSKFFPMKSLPALLNNEFHVTKSMKEDIKLRANSTLLSIRKEQLKVIIDEVEPNIIIIDTYSFTDALLIKELYKNESIKILFYQTRLSTELNNNYYGCFTGKDFKFIPSSKILRQQKIRRLKSKIIVPWYNMNSQLKHYFNQIGETKVKLNYNRFGMPSLSYLPEILLSSEISSSYIAKNQIYAGFNFRDNFDVHDTRFTGKLRIIVSAGSGVKYFSSFMHKYYSILNKIINYYSNIDFYLPKNYINLVMGKNIFFYSWDEYLNCISSSHLHITLSGINSIKDSLSRGVPTLNCPLLFIGDGPHNALMFEKIGLSLTWNIMMDSFDDVTKKIESLMGGEYKKRVLDFVKKDLEKYSIDHVKENFESLIHEDKWSINNW